MAATNEGIAAEIAVTTSTPVSTGPLRRPDSSPSPIPNARISSDAYRTSPAVVPMRDAISVETFSRTVIEYPRSPWAALRSHSPYWTKNGSFRW